MLNEIKSRHVKILREGGLDVNSQTLHVALNVT